MQELSTIASLLGRGQEGAEALAAPGRKPLSYSALRAQLEQIAAGLNRRGIGRNDRVAIVLSNGPEMASTFATVASCATTAPLNPGYRQKEFEFYLSDLGARALIAQAGVASPARDAATVLGVPILEIVVDPEQPAGSFELSGGSASTAAGARGLAEPDDVALVLHTSGTTSRPKIVALTHRNLYASAVNIRATLSLTDQDVCLNVMPLFHTHGLMAALLATFHAGASVCCTPGFDALRFFSWMQEAQPTWYTAVPTMHQAIVGRAGRNREVIEQARLRFIRSSSSSLPQQVMTALEETFDAPVIEAYGMAEASHQVTCNALPPGARKPGTVGPAAGPEVAIMDADNSLLGAGEVGEVVIRGPNVTLGYENNPDANAAAFCDGWFRTGDEGILDEDGYLRITGRLKEIINRGGEKISQCA